jgi:cyclic beta-1,2-glucan synthetase
MSAAGTHPPLPRVRLLGNGQYSVLVTAAGTGVSAWRGYALNAWSADRTEDAEGTFFYLRDLDLGHVWSPAYQPTAAVPDWYNARAEMGCFRIERVDDSIGTTISVCVAPDRDVELRVLAISNRSSTPRRLEVTSFSEIILLDWPAYAAHPAFTKLFLQTEFDAPAGVLLARRRKRGHNDPSLWMLHALHGPGDLGYETDRARFLGRGRSRTRPRALTTAAPLSRTVGNVLDPAFCLQRRVELGPGETAEVVFVSTAAESREVVLANAAPFSDRAVVQQTFAAAAAAEISLRHRLSISENEVMQYDDLAGAILYRHPAVHPGRVDACDRFAVLADLDIARRGYLIALHVTGEQARDVARQVLAAQSYWQRKGFEVDLAIATDDVAGIRWECTSREATAGERPRASILLVRQVAPEKLQLLDTAADAVIAGKLPAIEAWTAPPLASARARRATHPRSVTELSAITDSLRSFNGYGGFSADGKEYAIVLGPPVEGEQPRPPMPWINVVANESFGFLAGESGSGYTWSRNSRENRLTPWFNDPVADPYGEAVYLRDESSGAFWSPLPGPAPADAPYEVRHGFGYTMWRCVNAELEQDVTQFVPLADPVKITRLRLHNRSAEARRFSVYAYYRLVMGVLPGQTCRTIVTEFDGQLRALVARNPVNHEFADGIAFAAAVDPGARTSRYTCDRAAFMGFGGTLARPAAVADGADLDSATGVGLDPCFVLRMSIDIPAQSTVECAFVLGEALSREVAARLVSRYRVRNAIAAALEEAKLFWKRTLSAVRVQTPSPAIDLMVNGWLEYQTLACRIWGRSAFYQSGGAFGYRDQLQDAAALVYCAPALTRAQLLLHARHQFVEGDVLHWWHPPSGRGTRTRFADDLLWLPYVAAFYAAATGDAAVLDETADFVTARALKPGEDETYLFPKPAGAPATLYEHCCRAIDRSLTRGAHGLPLMGTGDWNDGMNLVGRKGQGESVWLGFFLCAVLGDFIPLCEQRGDAARTEQYREYREALLGALNDAGWDGEWYRRAYYDDGTPLGSAQNDECRIDALAQAWAVISKAAPRERGERAMAALERELVSADGRLIRLLAPPFDRTERDPGYIKGYVPGIRENGGQYTHVAMWTVRAFAELGRRDRAAALLEMLSPVTHAATTEDVARYQIEPYVVAADIYGVAPHLGRGGWSWYTGSAGWMHRVAVESVLGMTLEGGRRIRLKPCIPDDWPGFRLTYRVPESATCYEIEVINPAGSAAAVIEVTIDSHRGKIEGGAALIPLRIDGGVHGVRVILGKSPL